MVQSRIEHAHAVLVSVLRELDLDVPGERRVFEECLCAARLLGSARERYVAVLEARAEDEPEPLLQVA